MSSDCGAPSVNAATASGCVVDRAAGSPACAATTCRSRFLPKNAPAGFCAFGDAIAVDHQLVARRKTLLHHRELRVSMQADRHAGRVQFQSCPSARTTIGGQCAALT